VVALAYAGVTHQISGKLSALDSVLVELSDLCARYDVAYYREWALVLAGWRLGGSQGIAQIRVGLEHLTTERSLARMPYWMTLLADTLHRSGDTDGARAALDAGRVAAVQRDDVWWLPEVLRQAAAHQRRATAERTLEQALVLARNQSSVVLARRCEDDLARLRADKE
jgi:hypothetical protein